MVEVNDPEDKPEKDYFQGGDEKYDAKKDMRAPMAGWTITFNAIRYRAADGLPCFKTVEGKRILNEKYCKYFENINELHPDEILQILQQHARMGWRLKEIKIALEEDSY